MRDLTILRTLGIVGAVAIVVIGLVVLPSIDDAPPARAGISVGETSAAGGAAAPVSESVVQPPDESVALPAPTASEQPVRGIHSDTGVGAMEPEAPSEPAVAPQPAVQRPGGSGTDSSGNSSSSSASTSGSPSASSGGHSTTPRPSGVGEWDDGELESDDDDDDD